MWRVSATGAPSAAGDSTDATYKPDKITLRARLTLIYGLLFFAAGSLLVIVNYVIVAQTLYGLDLRVMVGDFMPDEAYQDDFRQGIIDSVLQDLTRNSVIALLAVGIIALVLGYAVAGRALSPLKRITRTARRLSERSLHERIALGGPDDEIRELADTFDDMLERLDRAFAGQRRFVANASHELRTPLAINRTLLEVALADADVSPDLKTVGHTLLETNSRHERLIEGLLLLAKSENELSERTLVDLREIATQVVSQLSADVSDANITVREELHSAPLTGDPVLLERLVANLVENAARYNRGEDGEIIIRVGRQDGAPALQVENPGPVIADYEVAGLFEPFSRGSPDRTRSSKSAGLGLSIVRSVVRAHGGELQAWPRPGGGLVVTVRFPAATH
ncbi:HAMP domain-containing protein [Spiractinospora alimapuensis]|uniref:sensor histidine kinase n=1 Tax=Spiractinospora alimapuensis TaxID=2820884 RepID=UPI001F3CF7AF|nr:ATP-binding protein [Spiractinospora alimapuensis]QVQ54575.1 HAMP domain-containing protein [Spiractinospora alimapuensis]